MDKYNDFPIMNDVDFEKMAQEYENAKGIKYLLFNDAISQISNICQYIECFNISNEDKKEFLMIATKLFNITIESKKPLFISAIIGKTKNQILEILESIFENYNNIEQANLELYKKLIHLLIKIEQKLIQKSW